MNSPMFVVLILLMAFSLKYRISWGNVWHNIIYKLFKSRINKKKIVKISNDFKVSYIELDKPMDYLRSVHQNKSDAEILNIQEKQITRILDELTKITLGKGSSKNHFVIKTFYPMNGKKNLVTRIEPKTDFGNQVVIRIMNEQIKENKGAWTDN